MSLLLSLLCLLAPPEALLPATLLVFPAALHLAAQLVPVLLPLLLLTARQLQAQLRFLLLMLAPSLPCLDLPLLLHLTPAVLPSPALSAPQALAPAPSLLCQDLPAVLQALTLAPSFLSPARLPLQLLRLTQAPSLLSLAPQPRLPLPTQAPSFLSPAPALPPAPSPSLSTVLRSRPLPPVGLSHGLASTVLPLSLLDGLPTKLGLWKVRHGLLRATRVTSVAGKEGNVEYVDIVMLKDRLLRTIGNGRV